MIDLTDTTLICIDDVNTAKALRVLEHCSSQIQFRDIKFFTSKDTTHPTIEIIKIDPITNANEYSNFCIAKLINYIDTKFIMFVQADGYICNFDAWDPRFKEVDYIGAPWYYGTCVIAGFPEVNEKNCVGNGGFSLRSRRIMERTLEIAIEENHILVHPEDAFMCRILRKRLEEEGFRFADIELASRFSLENNHVDTKYSGEFGWHGWRTRKNNPEIDTIL